MEIVGDEGGHEMRRLVSLIAVVVLLAGCSGGGGGVGPKPLPGTWAMKVNGYYTTHSIERYYTIYEPDPGYEFLVINLTVTNLTKEPQQLMLTDPFVSGNRGDWFEFLSGDDCRYIVDLIPTLFLPDPLPVSYKAQQVQTGSIAFQVLVGTGIEQGTLVFMSSGLKTIVLDTSGIPELAE
jgi:hypothetical protein